MICPRCDDQGLIYNAKIVELGIVIKLCDECEACWLENQPVKIENFKGLTTFLEENGLTYDNSTIEDLEYIDSSERNRTYFDLYDANEIIALIDEAWLMKGKPLIPDLGAYAIDMKRVIGTQGETGIKIIVKPETSEIKTAYPIKI